jgi:hypothetical protein
LIAESGDEKESSD